MKTFLHTNGKNPTNVDVVNPLVLVIEGNEDTRLMLRTLLEMRGMRVVEALDGKSGVSAAEEIQPDLILMDLTLPTLDGLGATRLIRERETLLGVPVVITSCHAHPKAQEAAFAAGCSDYLVMPFDFDELDCILLKYLNLKSDSVIAAGMPS